MRKKVRFDAFTFEQPGLPMGGERRWGIVCFRGGVRARKMPRFGSV